ncbi:MAG: hypothetical protein HFH93_12485 [Lachnospiraceae bacterium]|nr:hypothetical protein [Lachnospiraceae bacterium]
MGDLPTQLRHNALQLVKGNPFIWKIFLSNPESAFVKRLTDDTLHFLETEYSDLISQCKSRKISNHAEHYFTYQFLLHGMLRILKCWVDNGCQESVDKMESIIGKLNKTVITTLWHD